MMRRFLITLFVVALLFCAVGVAWQIPLAGGHKVLGFPFPILQWPHYGALEFRHPELKLGPELRWHGLAADLVLYAGVTAVVVRLRRRFRARREKRKTLPS